MTQYSKRMVIVHWLTLALVIAAWLLGESVDNARHEGNATLMGYALHGLVSGALLLLTLARLYFRRKDGTPRPVGQSLMDKAAQGVHYALYAVLLLLSVSGIMQVANSKVSDALMAWDVSLLPAKYTGVPAHGVHEVLVTVMIVLVAVHILGALKHQFIMKDNLMARMSLRRKD